VIIRLAGGILVTPRGPVAADLWIGDGRIRRIGGPAVSDAGPPPGPAAQTLEVEGRYVVPGFVDLHFHGYNLFEFTAGAFRPESGDFDASPAAYEAGFEMLRRRLPEFGVTSFLVASWAAPVEQLQRCYGMLARYLAAARDREEKAGAKGMPQVPGRGDARVPAEPGVRVPTEGREMAEAGARLLGGFLEGTFINPRMAGAQNPEFVFEPSLEVFERIAGGLPAGVIRLANVVPDFGEKSLELIRSLSARGIVVGAGHTAATADQVRRAARAGLRYLIHFTNGPTGGSFKPFDGGGAIEAGLAGEDLFLELILDGYHVNPAYVRDILRRTGARRITAATDALYAAGSPLKEVTIGGVHGRVSDDGRYIYVVGKPNTLCSSSLTMDRAFENLLNWLSVDGPGVWYRRHPALPFPRALAAAARACSANPCRLAGLAAAGFGSIREGAPADLAVLRIEGAPGAWRIAVEATIVGGRVVHRR
jgi:N-acetylglucosamine-6-phosphate deacetylase